MVPVVVQIEFREVLKRSLVLLRLDDHAVVVGWGSML